MDNPFDGYGAWENAGYDRVREIGRSVCEITLGNTLPPAWPSPRPFPSDPPSFIKYPLVPVNDGEEENLQIEDRLLRKAKRDMAKIPELKIEPMKFDLFRPAKDESLISWARGLQRETEERFPWMKERED